MSDLDRLLARARQLALPANPAPSPFGLAPAIPGAGRLRLLLNCSVRVLPQFVVAEQRGGKLIWLHSEAVPGSSSGNAPGAAPPSLGSFRHEISPGWRCLHCGTREHPAHGMVGFWKCGGCGSLNCAGADRRGWFRCACGAAVNGGFTRADFIEAHGTRAIPATVQRVAPSIPAPPVHAPAPARVASSVRLAAPPGSPPLRLPGRR